MLVARANEINANLNFEMTVKEDDKSEIAVTVDVH